MTTHPPAPLPFVPPPCTPLPCTPLPCTPAPAARRLGDSPIVHRAMHTSLGDNINGPSLIRRPDWMPRRPGTDGRYLLYFAHHKGRHIRLAVADRLTGPWRIHPPGVLPLAATPLAQTPPDPDTPGLSPFDSYPHLASPDIHVDGANRRLEMLFHGLADGARQVTYLALSGDGLDWRVVGPATPYYYLRRFTLDGADYAIGFGGRLLRRLADGAYECGPVVLDPMSRHVAVRLRGRRLDVLSTRVGDAPERLLYQALSLAGDWRDWAVAGPPLALLRPALAWEGADLPCTASGYGATDFSHGLRDPALFEEGDRLYLVYAGGGESALGLAEITGL